MSEWQSIETAPKDERWVFVASRWGTKDGAPAVLPMIWSTYDNDWDGFRSGIDIVPTHWMPMPAPEHPEVASNLDASSENSSK